jgi:hypothetical protein
LRLNLVARNIQMLPSSRDDPVFPKDALFGTSHLTGRGGLAGGEANSRGAKISLDISCSHGNRFRGHLEARCD